jgi:formylmethanofuran dehydrogenase subunit A
VPITYRDKSFVHALQWAIGLEWYLLVNDPWRIAMSTDHPNGGSFTAYPEIIALLMSREYRREVLKRLPPLVRERCTLWDLDREYTLKEIAIITRAAPARMLGLKAKGHLGIGADADVAVYSPQDDKRKMFELPRMVFKAGERIVDDGEIRRVTFGSTLFHEAGYDASIEAHLKPWWEKHYSIQFSNFPVGPEYIS